MFLRYLSDGELLDSGDSSGSQQQMGYYVWKDPQNPQGAQGKRKISLMKTNFRFFDPK